MSVPGWVETTNLLVDVVFIDICDEVVGHDVHLDKTGGGGEGVG